MRAARLVPFLGIIIAMGQSREIFKHILAREDVCGDIIQHHNIKRQLNTFQHQQAAFIVVIEVIQMNRAIRIGLVPGVNDPW